MGKIWTIARREYLAMVATKAFIISIAIMPLFMFGSLVISSMSEKFSKEEDKVVAIHDPSGKLFPLLKAASKAYNAALDSQEGDDGQEPGIELTRIDDETLSDVRRLELSDQVRDSDLNAFVEIPVGIFDDAPTAAPTAAIHYYSTDAPFSTAKGWLTRTINAILTEHRLNEANIDLALVQKASIPTPVKGMQLYSRDADGGIKSGEEKNRALAVFVPFGMMMFMFMIVMLTAQPMLESVLEEKTERIAEVLLGAANPFQIMCGKLLGNVCGSLSIFGIYLIGSYTIVRSQGWEDFVPFDVIPWFAAFQILAVLFFSSIFMAIGASVRQLKEAQGLMMPVWLTMFIPLFIWLPTLRSPNGTIATVVSFFPPSTPLMMVLRLSTDTPIPLWQTIAALLLMVVSTIGMVFVASRIFRVAILWQGKTPKVTELVRWAFTKN
jgi:ABC-2 type transport system permease protein